MTWNNTDTPLAIFFTFRTYGTWLHGDERGSIDRRHNVYGSPRIQPKTAWKKYNEAKLKHEPVILTGRRRQSVIRAIRETCEIRNWRLLAINVRTNHVHCVISIGTKHPDRALAAIKGNATRQMREDGCWALEHGPWAEKGSARRLWTEKSVAEAIDYTINEQGDKLPDFDWSK